MWHLIKRIGFIKKKLVELRPDVEFVIDRVIRPEEVFTFIDVGANTGQTIDFAVRKFKNTEVFSFEPTPDLFNNLLTKYRYNKKVHLFSLAFSDRDGLHSFYTSDFSATNSILKPNVNKYLELEHKLSDVLVKSKEININATRFDNWYVNNMNCRIIEIMKIDTQGFDFNVIAGGIISISKYVKIIIVELQFQKFYLNAVPFYKIFEILYKHNFTLLSLTEISKINKLQFIECNAVFLNNVFFKSANNLKLTTN